MTSATAARASALRAALDRNKRACDGVVNLVSSTDAQLGELRGIVGPINARTADLDRALRNLDVVGEETGAWLARIDSCRRADHALQDAERRRVIDDPRAWIARLDELADAEAFFAERCASGGAHVDGTGGGGGRRRATPGAENARARARELLARCVARTEGEFASAMRAHETRAVGIAHRPDAPRALASMRTLSGDAAELLDATIDDEHRGTPHTDVSSPTAGASRAEVHRAALLDVDPGFVALASHLLKMSSGIEAGLEVNTRAACIALYVDARTDACVDATNRDGLARLRAETKTASSAQLATRFGSDGSIDANTGDRGGVRSGDLAVRGGSAGRFGVGDGGTWVDRVARWRDVVRNAVARWELEPELAAAVLGGGGGGWGGWGGGGGGGGGTGEFAYDAVASASDEVLARAARHALVWLDELVDRPAHPCADVDDDARTDEKTRSLDSGGTGGGRGKVGSRGDLWTMAKQFALPGVRSGDVANAAPAPLPSGYGDDDPNEPGNDPERVFGCLDARAALLELLPAVEGIRGADSSAARLWRRAASRAAEGARASALALPSKVAREGRRLRGWADGTAAASAGFEPVTFETRAFALTVCDYCARLAARPDATGVLFPPADSNEPSNEPTTETTSALSLFEKSTVGGTQEEVPGSNPTVSDRRVSVASRDSDGILDFTDDDDDDVTDEDEREQEAGSASSSPSPSPSPGLVPEGGTDAGVSDVAGSNPRGTAELGFLLARALDAVASSLEDDDVRAISQGNVDKEALEDAVAKISGQNTMLAKVSGAMAASGKRAASSARRAAGKTTTVTSTVTTTVTPTVTTTVQHVQHVRTFRPALGAVRCAVAATVVTAGVMNPRNEGLLAALDRRWPTDARSRVRSYGEAAVRLAWGAPLLAMAPDAGPDPSAGMTDKQRRRVKDLWCVVNDRADAADAAVRAGLAWRVPSATVRVLREASVGIVGRAYDDFHARYAESGFTRRHPEKYVKRTPEEFEHLLRSMLASTDDDE